MDAQVVAITCRDLLSRDADNSQLRVALRSPVPVHIGRSRFGTLAGGDPPTLLAQRQFTPTPLWTTRAGTARESRAVTGVHVVAVRRFGRIRSLPKGRC